MADSSKDVLSTEEQVATAKEVLDKTLANPQAVAWGPR